MRKIFSKLLLVAMAIVMLFSMSACDDAETIQHNISVKSDKFETYRQVTVINLRSDKILLEIEGYISIQNSTESELAIIIKTGAKEYKMHYVYLANEVVYLVEQIENTHTDPYHWVIRIHAILPEFDTSK